MKRWSKRNFRELQSMNLLRYQKLNKLTVDFYEKQQLKNALNELNILETPNSINLTKCLHEKIGSFTVGESFCKTIVQFYQII